MTDLKFRKKPVVIEAVRWNGSTIGLTNGGASSYDEYLDTVPSPTSAHERLVIPSWMPPAKIHPSDWSEAAVKADVQIGEVARYLDVLYIGTLEGVMCAAPGDWVIRGVNGELYPCKPDIFAQTYEPAAACAAAANELDKRYWRAVQDFAHKTGCPAGGDVLKWLSEKAASLATPPQEQSD